MTTTATISNSYAAGSVGGTGATIGGLIGGNFGEADDSFWDKTTTGHNNGVGSVSTGVLNSVTGLNDAQMRTQSYFANVGWSFPFIWESGANGTASYPYFNAIFYPAFAGAPISVRPRRIAPRARIRSPMAGLLPAMAFYGRRERQVAALAGRSRLDSARKKA